MKTVAIVQARMSSSRFPGKVLEPLSGMPLILFMLARLERTRRVDEIIVATSEDPSDDALAECLRSHGQRCYRGSLDDVLARFHGAAAASKASTVVRLTGDCPLMDADLVDTVVARLLSQPGLDYASNVDPPSYPDGLDVEAFSFEALRHAFKQATLRSDREHVTPFIRRTACDRHTAVNVQALADTSHLRWTVDYPDDLQFISSLLAAAHVDHPSRGDRFDFFRAIELQPALLDINRHDRNEGLQKSLLSDKALTP